jgi:hypothetical protein
VVAQGKEGSSSFLKKRTKKLLSLARSIKLAHVQRPLAALSKSFLLLFFKKEDLPSLKFFLSNPLPADLS